MIYSSNAQPIVQDAKKRGIEIVKKVTDSAFSVDVESMNADVWLDSLRHRHHQILRRRTSMRSASQRAKLRRKQRQDSQDRHVQEGSASSENIYRLNNIVCIRQHIQEVGYKDL